MAIGKRGGQRQAVRPAHLAGGALYYLNHRLSQKPEIETPNFKFARCCRAQKVTGTMGSRSADRPLLDEIHPALCPWATSARETTPDGLRAFLLPATQKRRRCEEWSGSIFDSQEVKLEVSVPPTPTRLRACRARPGANSKSDHPTTVL